VWITQGRAVYSIYTGLYVNSRNSPQMKRTGESFPSAFGNAAMLSYHLTCCRFTQTELLPPEIEL